jgi:hypothetical protein
MVQIVTRLCYQIPNFTYPDTDSSTLLDAIVRQAVEADNSGFDTVMVMDHFYQLPGLGTPDQEMIECYTLLSALSQHTSKVRPADGWERWSDHLTRSRSSAPNCWHTASTA